MSQKEPRIVPKIDMMLRSKIVKIPESIRAVSGIVIKEKRIKSLLFTTDLAILRNHNADAVIGVYPFTPELSITQAILNISNVPVFVGVGGGITTGRRAVSIAASAELWGAYGVVVNSPTPCDVIRAMAEELDIPIVTTISSPHDRYVLKAKAGARVFNVSGGVKTSELVRSIRAEMGPDFPIIATGGKTDENIRETIAAGANAISYTPPSSAEIFADVMRDYREMRATYSEEIARELAEMEAENEQG